MDPMVLAYARGAAEACAGNLETLLGVVRRLKAQPDEAAVHMQRALDEIGRTCQVMNDAVSAFGELIDEPSVGTLVRLQGGGLAYHVENGRGHCHVVKAIYDRYLDTWFARVFGNANEYIELRTIFNVFEQGDSDFFHWFTKVAVDLQQEASDALALVRRGKKEEVRARVWQVLTELAPVQIAMNRIVTNLAVLKNELLQSTGSLPFRP